MVSLAKDSLYNQPTISDCSEDVKQIKTMKLSVLKSATCEPCWKLNVVNKEWTKLHVTLHRHIFLFFVYKKTVNSLLVLVIVSLVFIMINKLNPDQALIQIKKKVRHIDSAQRSQTDGLSHWRTGRYIFAHIS